MYQSVISIAPKMENKVWKNVMFLCCVIIGIQNVDCQCTSLEANSSYQHFESHTSYGTYDYSNNYDACWVITADSGQIVELQAVEFDTEYNSGCNLDYLALYDGTSLSGDYRDSFCGSLGFSTFYSIGQSLYLKFETDSSITNEGFKLRYKSVDEDEYCKYYGCGLSTGAIVGIVIGSLILLGLIVGIIICIVCCVNASKPKRGRVLNNGQATVVHTNAAYVGTRQNVAYGAQQSAYVGYIGPNGRATGYPQQQPGVVPVGVAAGANQYQQQPNQYQVGAPVAPPPYQSGKPAAPPPAYGVATTTSNVQPVPSTQSHPVDANGVPTAAIYNDPAQQK